MNRSGTLIFRPSQPECCSQGVKHAVPKTLLQLMNVEGMTRENVASHLQVCCTIIVPFTGLLAENQ